MLIQIKRGGGTYYKITENSGYVSGGGEGFSIMSTPPSPAYITAKL